MSDGIIKIVLDGNTLSIYNNGEPFDEAGVSSLLVPFNSSKGNGLIGNKGLGFRALLNESKTIWIMSEGLSIRFGRDDNREYYEKCNDYHLLERSSILLTPRVVKPLDTDGYTTMVRVQLKDDDAITRLQGLIDEIDGKTLLFLHAVKERLSERDGGRHQFKKESRGNK